jgi:hypothetical protein
MNHLEEKLKLALQIAQPVENPWIQSSKIAKPLRGGAQVETSTPLFEESGNNLF